MYEISYICYVTLEMTMIYVYLMLISLNTTLNDYLFLVTVAVVRVRACSSCLV